MGVISLGILWIANSDTTSMTTKYARVRRSCLNHHENTFKSSSRNRLLVLLEEIWSLNANCKNYFEEA